MGINQETMYAVALTRIGRFSPTAILQLYNRAGSASAVMENIANIRDIIPDATPRLVQSLANMSDALKLAEAEMMFDEAHGITPMVFGDSSYPTRLRECNDAPLVLFYRGTANLNQRRILSIVGTRHCTMYGQDMIRRLVADLKEVCPEVLIVSGLAYGVDINAHRQALQNGYETVGVLAHGLDYLYPNAHRDTARKMLSQGGLVTEFCTHTNADKLNFIRRNRIVAGMADATLLVESAAHGGGLITAGIASGYGRDVFAFPGNVGMEYSEGCNNLIRDNKAMLITGADDIVKAMGWQDDSIIIEARRRGIERQLFPDLTPNEQKIADLLRDSNDLSINEITTKTRLATGEVVSVMFGLEMKGVVKQYAGGVYHIM